MATPNIDEISVPETFDHKVYADIGKVYTITDEKIIPSIFLLKSQKTGKCRVGYHVLQNPDTPELKSVIMRVNGKSKVANFDEDPRHLNPDFQKLQMEYKPVAEYQYRGEFFIPKVPDKAFMPITTKSLAGSFEEVVDLVGMGVYPGEDGTEDHPEEIDSDAWNTQVIKDISTHCPIKLKISPHSI